VTLEHLASAMEFRARGRLLEAWAACLVAAASLPPYLRHDSATGARARLTREPNTGDIDAYLFWWASRLVFREQHELADLRRRFAHDRAAPREELIEVYIEYVSTGRVTDCSRSAFLARATRLRHFAGSTRGDVSQSVWTDAGGADGLRALASRELAERPVPAPWYGRPGTEGLPVCLDRLRMWCLARPRPSSVVG
jgi:hypothetical protein